MSLGKAGLKATATVFSILPGNFVLPASLHPAPVSLSSGLFRLAFGAAGLHCLTWQRVVQHSSPVGLYGLDQGGESYRKMQ